MPYTNNPNISKVRMRAVHLVYQGWSTRKVGRHFGVGSSTISKWVKKDKLLGLNGWRPILTESSRPHHHPRELSEKTIEIIVAQRKQRNRCSEVVHQELINQGIVVSLSSIKRTLDRQGLIRKRSPWKRWHFSLPRPEPINAGDLAQIDTIHIVLKNGFRFYIYTLIDVFSRWAYAKVSMRINTHLSLKFVQEAQRQAGFKFRMIQSDHGSEFSSWFTENAGVLDISHRHSRIRKPNDNAHIKRFNRSLQEECLDKVLPVPAEYQKAIDEYLPYYNNRRLHLGINLKTPLECVQAID